MGRFLYFQWKIRLDCKKRENFNLIEDGKTLIRTICRKLLFLCQCGHPNICVLLLVLSCVSSSDWNINFYILLFLLPADTASLNRIETFEIFWDKQTSVNHWVQFSSLTKKLLSTLLIRDLRSLIWTNISTKNCSLFTKGSSLLFDFFISLYLILKTNFL